MSPSSGFYFFLKSAKWRKCTHARARAHTHTHTHTKALPTNLCCFTKSLLKGPQPLQILLENISSVITMVIFTYNCMFHFSILVSAGSQKQFGVIYFKTWGSTQPYVVFWTLVFCSGFMFGQTHKAPNSLTLHEPVSVVSQSSLFSWLVDGADLLCLVVWGRGTLPDSCIRSLTNVSLKWQCDNFEPQEVRMIKLLKMVRSRRRKNSFFVHFQVHLLIL